MIADIQKKISQQMQGTDDLQNVTSWMNYFIDLYRHKVIVN
jgi:hypothetical protein